MTKIQYASFFQLLDNIVNEEGKDFKEKRNELMGEASEDDKTNLVEFAAWFEEDEEEDTNEG